MKSWIWLFVISAVVIEVLGYNAEEAITTCLKENNVTPEEVAEHQSGRSNGNPSRKIKCYQACNARKIGWLTESGDILQDKLFRPIYEVPEEHRRLLETLIEECTKKQGDPCETANFVFDCINEFTGRKRGNY